MASLEAAKVAGVALARLKKVDAELAIDAIVMATAALLDAIVVTDDTRDFETLANISPASRCSRAEHVRRIPAAESSRACSSPD